MRAWTYCLGLSLVSFATWGGCSNDEETTTTAASSGGSSSSTAVASTVVSASTGMTQPCSGAPNGACQIMQGEDCTCSDCTDTGMCTPGACVLDDGGFCDPDLDSCICADCEDDYNCGDPADLNCVNDGTCDPQPGGVLGEGCNCEDCWALPECADNVMLCEGQAADNVCNLPTEDCGCVDCLGALGCDPCNMDNVCDYEDSCHCADCLNDPFCTNPQNCFDDMICAPLYEGCHCIDCATAPACSGTGGAGGN